MIIGLLLSALIVIFGFYYLWLISRRKKQLGILNGIRIYEDTNDKNGEILYAKSINLAGKPDYIMKLNGTVIPVEVKTGKTPKSPYLNHSMQLMAYCFLVEETYGVRPPGGILKYPKKEFKLAYTEDAEKSIRSVIMEIQEAHITGVDVRCKHREHNTDL